jgi:hypothetical protein
MNMKARLQSHPTVGPRQTPELPGAPVPPREPAPVPEPANDDPPPRPPVPGPVPVRSKKPRVGFLPAQRRRVDGDVGRDRHHLRRVLLRSMHTGHDQSSWS